jgi:DNA-binding transcriptional ArsR family regulator
MLNNSESLDLVFQALSDASRRAIVEQLSQGPASVGALAEPLDMTLPAVMQHLRVLEDCGLVRSDKTGRVRTCRIQPTALNLVDKWISARRASWNLKFDRLGELLDEEDRATKSKKRKS